ncbi:probable E3 ubiquitin-protein ligase DTX2 [Lingula anatina]|uniref:E3 ubiquitin-protein ligase n=1 Tax=Lingula anatina TaxID=7574 RepID=A0A1S3J6M7_LINAN|nr:probable E3 ubiquitin-protein ligase DTX2 [Lingula anatina]|eukprot:XP_013406045.1 probable E3 ubiquitin-protein ligase DTX2 [Lingula anatina]
MAASCTSPSGVVVWEWMNEFGRWRPYEPGVSNYIENHTTNGVTLYLKNVDPKLSMYKLDLQNYVQIAQHTGKQRQIRRKIYLADSAPGKGIVWKWEGDQKGEYHAYDLDIANFLEKAYMSNQQIINIQQTFSNCPYTVDFRRMTQQRNETGFPRQVQRIFLPVSYTFIGNKTLDHPIVGRKRSHAVDQDVHALHGHTSKRKSNSLPPISQPPNGFTFSAALLSTESTFSNSFPNANYQSSGLPLYSYTNPNTSQGSLSSSQPTQCKVTRAQPFTVNTTINPRPFIFSPANNSLAPSWSTPSGANRSFGILPDISGAYTRLFGGTSTLSSYSPSPQLSAGLNLPATPNATVPIRSTSRGASRSGGNVIYLKEKSTPTSAEEVLHNYVTIKPSPEDEDCCICCEKLNDASGYDSKDTVVFQLRKCSHMFHKACLHAMYENGQKDGSIQCPTCKTIYGQKFGNCPDGSMEYHLLPQQLPGYRDCGTIQIIYKIPRSGIQGPEHPNPGQMYTARGFPRVGYLPDNDKGRKVLQLLIKAWERRLIFTIGMSTTTGEQDTVTWNEIHHKTEIGTNHSGHGYPDPKYLDNVIAELAAQGVTDEDE